MKLEELIGRWERFRRALRRRDREAFDSMVNRARMHASASSFDIRLDAFESLAMSILLGHERALSALKGRLEGLERTLKGPAVPGPGREPQRRLFEPDEAEETDEGPGEAR